MDAAVDLRARVPVRVDVARPDPDLVTFAALAQAAADLGPEWIAAHRAVDLPLLLPDGAVERVPGPPDDVVRGIAGSDAWAMIKGLGHLERYRPLTRRTGAVLQLAARAAGEVPTVTDLIAFVAGGGTRVPLHVDTGHHVLHQLEATKTVLFGWYDDPEVERAVLADSVGRGRTNPDRLPDRIEEMVLAPGEAVVIPAFCVHGVADCSGPSVALTVALRTDATEARVRDLGSGLP